VSWGGRVSAGRRARLGAVRGARRGGAIAGRGGSREGRDEGLAGGLAWEGSEAGPTLAGGRAGFPSLPLVPGRACLA
jgi:hypothetical protein